MKIVVAIIPTIIYAIILYMSDKKEKEPVKELLKAFMLGCISILLTLTISYLIGIDVMEPDYTNFISTIFYSFVCIALIEELSKFICAWIVVRKNKNFDYIYDGIVYFATVSLGFAAVENVLYATVIDMNGMLLRAILTMPAHILFGIVSGYCYSNYRIRKIKQNKGKIYFLFSFIIPIILHGFYDFCVLYNEASLFLIYIVFVASLIVIAVDKAKKLEKNDRKFEE